MAASLEDSLKSKHSQEFAQLKRGARRSLLAPLLIIGGLVMSFLLISNALNSYRLESGGLLTIQTKLERRNLGWVQDLLIEHSDYRGWIISRGTDSELGVFDNVSHALLQTALTLSSDREEARSPGFLSRVYISLVSSGLRVSFIILASWRFALFLVIAAIAYAASSLPIWLGQDVLGKTGNGRLFYSGIRVGLEDLTPGGAPSRQLPGLACPKMVSDSEAGSSEIFQLLKSYEADSRTAKGLIAVLLAHPEWPGFTGDLGREEALYKAFEGCSLHDLTKQALETTLEIQAKYIASESAGAPVSSAPQTDFKMEGERLTFTEYSVLLPYAMDRVLTPAMRRRMTEISPEVLAVAVLAQQAGKVLAYAFEAGRWGRRSRFPLLSARAVLHSIPYYVEEFNYDERLLIRRSIIYGSRISVFGPVRFPLDLTERTRAVRQWVEVLDALPHEMQNKADSVELYGIVSTLRDMWEKALAKRLEDKNSAFRRQSVATQTGLLFVPVTEIVKIFKEIVRSDVLLRLEALCARVSKRERVVDQQEFEDGDIDDTIDRIPSYERIFEHFSDDQMAALSSGHKISETTVRVWSSLRAVLNSGSWLARRVGDYSVPESSVIFAVFSGMTSTDEGKRGLTGAIPLRGSHFETRYGKNWFTMFQGAQSAEMSNEKSEYERLLGGELKVSAEATDSVA